LELAMSTKRATVCVEADDAAAVAQAEVWLDCAEASLSYFANWGCGCCVIGWDVEGPGDLIDSIPEPLKASSPWADGHDN
jgi:hypothetical protein